MSCAVILKTPDEARAYMKEHSSGDGRYETIKVDRPYVEVIKSLEKGAKQCLDKVIKQKSIQTQNNGLTNHATTRQYITTRQYKPTLLLGDDKAELHLQFIMPLDSQPAALFSMQSFASTPEEGGYLLGADIFKQQDGTKALLYGSKRPGLYADILNLIEEWIMGKEIRCPELAR